MTLVKSPRCVFCFPAGGCESSCCYLRDRRLHVAEHPSRATATERVRARQVVRREPHLPSECSGPLCTCALERTLQLGKQVPLKLVFLRKLAHSHRLCGWIIAEGACTACVLEFAYFTHF